jgi:protein-S-isoprenylcysteine O-methyltransferase Ste14
LPPVLCEDTPYWPVHHGTTGFDGPIAFALLPLVLIGIQTQVIFREERYLEAKFGDDYRRYKAEVRRWL